LGLILLRRNQAIAPYVCYSMRLAWPSRMHLTKAMGEQWRDSRNVLKMLRVVAPAAVAGVSTGSGGSPLTEVHRPRTNRPSQAVSAADSDPNPTSTVHCSKSESVCPKGTTREASGLANRQCDSSAALSSAVLSAGRLRRRRGNIVGGPRLRSLQPGASPQNVSRSVHRAGNVRVVPVYTIVTIGIECARRGPVFYTGTISGNN
jgi:hypothetical protein